MDLRFCSYNCCSLNKNIDIVRELTDGSYDIIMLQETMLIADRLGDLGFIGEDYESVGIGAVFSEKSLESISGRPQGGIACLWRKNSVFNVDKIVLDENIIIMCISIGDFKILFINLYLNSDLLDSITLNNYLNNLNKLESILGDYDYDCIYFVGDFNADPFVGRAWKNLTDFRLHNNLKCFDFDALDRNTFTFTSYGGSYCKWLDHFVGRDCVGAELRDIEVHYDLVGSDHLPMSGRLVINDDLLKNRRVSPLDTKQNISYYIEWEKLDINEIEIIEDKILDSAIDILDCGAARCKMLGCHDQGHLNDIFIIYDKLISAIQENTLQLRRERKKKNKFKVIPGWNRNVKELHKAARQHYLNWIRIGKPRDTIDFDLMTESRGVFKKALTDCKRNEIKEIGISIESKFRDKDKTSFWKEVKQKKCNNKKSSIIDGKSSDHDILNIFTDKFLASDVEGGQEEPNEIPLIDSIKNKWKSCRKMNLHISPDTIKKLSARLSNGNGHDGLHPFLLKKGSPRFLKFMSKFINICYSHCIFPPNLLKGDLNPTVKNPKGNTTESDNYRPVMQSSCLLKLMELHILSVLEEKVHFNPRQFGFSKGNSTSDACYLLKETAHKYIKDRGKLYAVFVDLSKAFDMVDHCLLGQKMLEKSIPPDLVLLLMCYLRNQSARVCWNNSKGEYCTIHKGVRQGGILSPFLFKLYIESLMTNISEVELGCRLGFVRPNVIGYADDIVLLADSAINLENLYDILREQISILKLKMNRSKSKCIVFEQGSSFKFKDITLMGDIFEVVESYKYLGHLIQRQLHDIDDIKYRLNIFYGKFNSVYRNFNSVSIETLLFLFNTYCLPDYGLCLWNTDMIFNRQIFKAFETAFSNAFKKILGAPRFSSSHVTAFLCNQFLLRHHIAIIQWRYIQRLSRSKNIIIKLCSSQLKSGYLFESVSRLYKSVYSMDMGSGDMDIIKARVAFVQNHEERRGTCHFYGF